MHEPQTSVTQNQLANSYAIPAAIIIAGIAIALAIYFGGGKHNEYGQYGTQQVVALDPAVTNTDHYIGNLSGKVTIVEYSDTECPFCKIFHGTMHKIMAEYGASGDVAWVYRQFPIVGNHAKAPKESEATECVAKLGGNEKFWQYLNTIFETTPANDGLDLAKLPQMAAAIGIDEKAFNECLSGGEMKALVDASIESGKKVGVGGTPFSLIVVDGKVVDTINGAQPFEIVKAQIDAVLEK